MTFARCDDTLVMAITNPRSDARSLPALAQEDLRRKAVRAVVEDGMKQYDVAKLFGVARGTVNHWVKTYKEQGTAGLRACKRGRPRAPSVITSRQEKWVQKAILGGCPGQQLLPFVLWTREAVRALLAERFLVNVSLSTIGRLLARWGFTPQRPKRRAYERDDAAAKKWIEEEYPKIAARAKRKNAEIHWGDQTGIRADDQRGRSYSKRGITPVVKGTGKRFKFNMMSSLTNRGHLAFMVFKENFNWKVMIRFLKLLIRQCAADKARRGEKPGKVFLIVDGHSVHSSKTVSDFVSKHSDELELFFLPGYCPELNPDELVNHDVKAAIRSTRPKEPAEMLRVLTAHMRRRRRDPGFVRRFFNQKDVRYAAA